ncbi:MAG: GntR family transcriptional regulator, partial [Planctomycetes bacterium]|nr:GntR family transcriptional regulator [Planctomycetota bacterium]
MAMKTAARAPWKGSFAPKGDQPLYRQIEGWVRRAIADGALKPGDRVPSVVELAEQLRVNKLTVLRSFRDLEKEGLLSSHVGRGTFVADAGGGGAAGGVTAQVAGGAPG